MTNLWALAGQAAYLLMFLGLLGWNVDVLRKFFLTGSALAVLYALGSELEPLWVPLTWHAAFLTLNSVHIVAAGLRKRKERLDPLEQFMQKTAFGLLAPEDIKALASLAVEGEAPVGQALAAAGEPSKELCFLLQGNVGIFLNGERVSELSAGRILGVSGFLGDTKNPYDVVATTDLKVVLWSQVAIEKWVGRSTKRLGLLQAALGAQLVEQILKEAAGIKKAAQAGMAA